MTDACDKYKSRHVKSTIKYTVILTYLTLAYVFADIIGVERDPFCTMRAGFSAAMAAWVLVSPVLLIYLLFLIVYSTKTAVPDKKILLAFVGGFTGCTLALEAIIWLLGYSVWFFWNQALWSDLSSS